MFIESTPELASLVLFVFRDRLTRSLGRIHNQQEQEQEKNKGMEADEAENNIYKAMCQKQRCRMPSVKCAKPAVVWVLSRQEAAHSQTPL